MPHPQAPFTCPTPPPRLPLNPHDGDTVCDAFGNIFKFQAVEDAWIFYGTLKTPKTVTENNDGAVPPEIFNRIQYIKSATNNGRDLPKELKIRPHTDSYWYLFHSSDKLFRFLPESESVLRIEIDRARLFTYLVKQSKRGQKGLLGNKGDKGLPANFNPLSLLSDLCTPEPPKDECFKPESVSADGKTITFKLDVEILLDTNISLRLQKDDTSEPSIIIDVPVDGDNSKVTITIVDTALKLDQNNTKKSIKFDGRVLSGSFILEDGIWSIFCIKARQKGPIGDKGDDAPCTLKPKECVIDDDSIKFTDPIISLRRGCNDNQFLSTTSNLFQIICVDKLRIDVASPGADQLISGSIISGRLLAAEVTLDQCKDLVKHTPAIKPLDMPKLELPEWKPQSDCQNNKYYDQSSLNWVPNSNSPMYPWQISVPPRPSGQNVCDPCLPNPRPPGSVVCSTTTTIAPTPTPTSTTLSPTTTTSTPTSTTTSAPTTTTTTTSTTTTSGPTTSTTTTTLGPIQNFSLGTNGAVTPTIAGISLTTNDLLVVCYGAVGIFNPFGPSITWAGNPTLNLNHPSDLVDATFTPVGIMGIGFYLVTTPATGSIVLSGATEGCIAAVQVINLPIGTNDKTSSGIFPGAPNTAADSGLTAATVQANEYLQGLIGTGEPSDSLAGTWLNSFTDGQSVASAPGGFIEINEGFRIVSSIGAYKAAKTLTFPAHWYAQIVTFK